MHTSRLTLFFIFSLASITAYAETVSVPTFPDKADHYPWITYLSESPSNDKDQAYRVVITTSEIYSTVFLEQVTYGDEGCCKKLSWVHKLDLNTLDKKFGLHGEQAGFTFVRWLSPTSFIFSYHERNFTMSDIDKIQVKVESNVGG